MDAFQITPFDGEVARHFGTDGDTDGTNVEAISLAGTLLPTIVLTLKTIPSCSTAGYGGR